MFEPSVVFVDEPLLDVDVDSVADSSVGQWLAVLEAWGPSASSLGVLTSLDPAVLSRDDRETFLLLVDRHVAWLEAGRLWGRVAVAGLDPDGDATGREDVAVLIGLSPDAAQRRIDTARALHTRLPRTQDALTRGAISPLHVMAVSEATENLSDQDAAAVEARVFPRAETQTLAEFRRALKRAVARVSPISSEVAQADAASRRSVSMWAEPDGMARLEAYLPAADAQTIWLALDGLARADRTTTDCSVAEVGDRSGEVSREPDPVTGRRRPIDARRADALVAMAAGVLADPSLPRRHGRPVIV